MENQFTQKLSEESALTAAELSALDQALDAQESDMKSILGQLPTPEPSLMWRSALNEKLREVQVVSRKKAIRLRWGWMSGLTTVGAAACAILIFTSHASNPPGQTSISAPKLEMALVDSHRQDSSKIAMGFDVNDNETPASETF